MKIALLQPRKSEPLPEWENSLGWYPNVRNGLIVSDLRKQGHECDYLLAFDLDKDSVSREVVEYLNSHDYDLLFYFPDFGEKKGLNFEKEYLEKLDNIKVVTKGFIKLFGIDGIEYNIIGPRREASKKFVEYLKGKAELEEVPNLFYKEDGIIGSSGKVRNPEIGGPLTFDPVLDFKVFGRVYFNKVNCGEVTVPGCPYGKKIRGLKLQFDESYIEGFKLSEEAKEMLRSSITKRGCSFCRKKNISIKDKEGYLESIFRQLDFWFRYFNENGIENKAIKFKGESAVLYLDEIYEKMDEEDLSIFLHSRSDYIANLDDKLEKSLSLGKKKSFKTILGCMGFESFSKRDLEFYNKGFGPEINIKALNNLKELKEKYPRTFFYKGKDHGFIMFNPKTDINSLERNLACIKELDIFDLFHSPFLLTRLMAFRTTPNFFKGLDLEPKESKLYDVFEFNNKEIGEIYRKLSDFYQELGKRRLGYGPEMRNRVLARALEVLLEESKKNELKSIKVENLIKEVLTEFNRGDKG